MSAAMQPNDPKENSMPEPQTHRIRHYVYGIAGDRSTLIPREAGMRGGLGLRGQVLLRLGNAHGGRRP